MSRKSSLITIHLTSWWQLIAVLITYFLIIIVVQIIKDNENKN